MQKVPGIVGAMVCQEATEIDTPGVYWSCFPMVVSAVTGSYEVVVVIDESGEGEILDPDTPPPDVESITLVLSWLIPLASMT